MGLWTMRGGGTRRIGLRQAERLLAGRGWARYPGLVALLSDAAGPARPKELSGEPGAVAAFRRLRSAAPSTVDLTLSTVDIRRPTRPLWRSAVVRLAAIVVLLAAAGTATVKFMYQPAPLQPVPPITPSTAPVADSPSPSTSSPAGPSQRPSPAPTGLQPSGPAPLAGTSSSRQDYGAPKLAADQSTLGSHDADVAEATRLCRIWTDPSTDRADRTQAAEELRQLMAVLDGPNGTPAFCRKLISPKKDK